MSSLAFGALTDARQRFDPDPDRNIDQALVELKSTLSLTGNDAGKKALEKAKEAVNSKRADNSGIKTYIDAAAALVPSEALALYGVLLTGTGLIAQDVTTDGDNGGSSLELSSTRDYWIVVGLCALFSVVLFLAGKYLDNGKRGLNLEPMDGVRIFIPPLALLCWIVLQPGSAIWVAVNDNGETVLLKIIAVAAVAFLGIFAGLMAGKSKKNPAKT